MRAMNTLEEEEISGNVSSLPFLPNINWTTVGIVAVVATGLIALLVYETGKKGVRFVGEHPEVLTML